MPTRLGAHSARIDFARELRTRKGRRAHGRFAFEGETLLREALDAGIAVETIYATQQAYDGTPGVRDCEARGIALLIIDERAMRRISDVETPSGILAVAPIRLEPAARILERPGLVLLLADLNDPGNAGTLLRSAEAFGVDRVLFGSEGVDPYLPKVVRAAMGALFRLDVGLVAPAELAAAPEWIATGLRAGGEPLEGLCWPARSILVVGQERHGLARWEAFCGRFGAIPMAGTADSLNAAAAGSIALYEATRHRSS